MDHGHGHGHGHGQPLAGRGTTMDHAMDQTQPGAVGGGHTERGVRLAVAQEENERPSVKLQVHAAQKVECTIR